MGGGCAATLLVLLALVVACRRSLEIVDRIGQRIQAVVTAVTRAIRGEREGHAPPHSPPTVRQPRNLTDEEMIEMRGRSGCPTRNEPARQVWL